MMTDSVLHTNGLREKLIFIDRLRISPGRFFRGWRSHNDTRRILHRCMNWCMDAGADGRLGVIECWSDWWMYGWANKWTDGWVDEFQTVNSALQPLICQNRKSIGQQFKEWMDERTCAMHNVHGWKMAHWWMEEWSLTDKAKAKNLVKGPVLCSINWSTDQAMHEKKHEAKKLSSFQEGRIDEEN